MKFKRQGTIFLILVLTAAMFVSCAPNNSASSGSNNSTNSTQSTSDSVSTQATQSTSGSVSTQASESTKADSSTATSTSDSINTQSTSQPDSKSDSQSTSQADSNSQPASSTAANTGEAKTITVWGMESNVSLLTAATVFQEQNKNVTIKIQNHDRATVNDLKMALAANKAPDVIFMDQTYLGAAGSLNYLKNLNDYGAKDYEGKFIPSTWASVQLKGMQWGMPFDANTIAMIYNKDMLTAANASIPTNYAELQASSDKVRTRYPNAFGYTQAFNDGEPGGKNWIAFSFFNWLWRMGGDVLSSDYKTATFNSQAGVEALQMLVDMKTAKQASPVYLHDNFFTGDNSVAITNIGSWTYERVFSVNKKANYSVALLPVLKAGVKPYSGLGLYGYAVTSASKNPQDAFNFVAFYTTKKAYQLDYCKKNLLIPSLIEAHSDSFYSKPEWKVMIQQLGYSKFRPSVQGWDQIENNLADAIQSAMSGARTPKSALDTAARYANSVLSRYVK